jgi:hypothetical protein
VPPPGPASVPFIVTVYDATGTVELYRETHAAPVGAVRRFSVGSLGGEDSGAHGDVWIDDLVVLHADGTQREYAFETEPVIVESTTGSEDDVLRYDEANDRLVAVGNSGYSFNYESLDLGGHAAAVTRIRFRFSRPAGDTGDGSWWDLHIGLAPGDAEHVGGTLMGANPGFVDNLAGIHLTGNGDGDRRDMRSIVDGERGAREEYLLGGIYVVDIEMGSA